MAKAKDPAFLFYTSDFMTGTQDLTMEERGQYITLLCLQHQKGHLTDKMIRLCVGNAAADVMAKFRQDSGGLWYNVRLDIEIEKRAAHGKKQSQRALEGWEKRKNKAMADATAHAYGNAAALPLEDENENVIEDEVVFKKESLSKSEIIAGLFNDQRFVEQLQMTHPGKDLKQAFEECYTHHANGPSPPVVLWEWKQKLNTWLAISKPHGKSKSGNRNLDHAENVAKAFAETYSSTSGNGPAG